MRQVAIASLPLAALVVSGCGQNRDMSGNESASLSDSGQVNEAATAPNPDFDPAQPGVGNEYYYIDLLALRDGDERNILPRHSERYCSFKDDAGRILLKIAVPAAGSAKALGVARPNGKGARKFAAEVGGPDYVVDGPVMRHDGAGSMEPMRLEVKRGAGEGHSPKSGMHEWLADLAVSDPNGDRRPYAGRWRCDV